MYKWETKPVAALRPFVLLLSPYAPHVSEELWSRLGGSGSLAYEPWPEHDESLLVLVSPHAPPPSSVHSVWVHCFKIVVVVVGKFCCESCCATCCKQTSRVLCDACCRATFWIRTYSTSPATLLLIPLKDSMHWLLTVLPCQPVTLISAATHTAQHCH